MTCIITHPTLTVTTLWCGNHHEPCLKSEGTERSHEYETAPIVVQIASHHSLHVDPPVPLSSKLRDRWVSSYCLHARPATQLSWFSIFSPTPCHDFGGQGWITRCRFLAQVDPKFLILLPPLPEMTPQNWTMPGCLHNLIVHLSEGVYVWPQLFREERQVCPRYPHHQSTLLNYRQTRSGCRLDSPSHQLTGH